MNAMLPSPTLPAFPPIVPFWVDPPPITWVDFRPDPSARERSARILVVDDDAAIAATVTAILEDEGYSVLVARDGAEALGLLEGSAGAVDLILLDMRMPGMDGWAFAQAYRQLPRPHAPVVTMTAAHSAQTWASEIASEGVLPKPFELTDLLSVVERFTA